MRAERDRHDEDMSEPTVRRRSVTATIAERLVTLAVIAIVAMPFVAGRHPSGAQTVLVLAACCALTAIAVALLARDRRRAAQLTGYEQVDELAEARRRAHG